MEESSVCREMEEKLEEDMIESEEDMIESISKINILTNSESIGTDIYSVGVPVAYQTNTSDSDLQSSSSEKSKRQRTKVSQPPTTRTEWVPEFIEGERNTRVIATPLFELSSVHIDSSQFQEFDKIKIYGTVVLVDGDLGNEFRIFDCKRERAKTVVIDHASNWSAILERFELGSPRCLTGKLWLRFQLKRLHGAEDIEIMDDWKLIDCSHEVTYDKPQLIHYINSYGQSVIVTATIFQCATLANVGVVVEEAGNVGSAAAEMRILAVNRLFDMSFCERVLLAGSQEESDFGNFNLLCTLAVPAYSTLQIKGQVWVDGELVVDGLVEFEPNQGCSSWYERQIEEEKYRIRVIVHWYYALTSLREAEILEWYAVKELNTGKTPTSIILETGEPYYVPPILDKYLEDMEWEEARYPNELLEIFSISICSYNNVGDIFHVHGSIQCFDSSKCQDIFNDTVICSFPSCGSIKLVPDLARGFTDTNVGVEIMLKDAQGGEVSYGCFAYDYVKIDGWYDRRICAVIRGQAGFAAVHYTVFQDAVQAKLFFKVVSDIAPEGAGCEVRGRISTWYTCYRYSTHYEKKYYRSTLFEKEELVKLSGGEIPLSKPAVAVPLDFGSLVVGGSIYVLNGKQCEKLEFEEIFSPKESDDKKLKFEKTFCAEESDGKSPESDFRLSVRVEWAQPPPPSRIFPDYSSSTPLVLSV